MRFFKIVVLLSAFAGSSFVFAEECSSEVRSLAIIAEAESALVQHANRQDNPYQYGLTLSSYNAVPRICFYSSTKNSAEMRVRYDLVEVYEWGDGTSPEGDLRIGECDISLEKYDDEWNWTHIVCEDLDIEAEN